MIKFLTILKTADNTGAKKLRVIGIPHFSKRKFASLGDVVRCVVDGATTEGTVKDEEKVLVVVVRTRKEKKRGDGSYVRFDDNAGVLIDDHGNPRGTRIFGPVAREVKERGFTKIASLAQEVV